jgi:nicotinamide-nucleotide amidase
MGRDANPLVGTTVAAGVITVRITARGANRDEAAAVADATVAEVRRRLGDLVYGVDDDTMPAVVAELLVRAGATLSVAESCTGGLLGKMLTDSGGATAFFRGGVISYANEAKTDLLGVPADLLDRHGAVSAPTAEAMARGARSRFGSTYALAITGVAGPTGGTAAKPVGLVYTALAEESGVRVLENHLVGDRQAIRMRSALTALNMVRLRLQDEGVER